MAEQLYSPSLSVLPSSSSFTLAPSAGRFDYSKTTPAVKRIDFPVKPHILKYLLVHLKLTRIEHEQMVVDDYVLSNNGRFGLALTSLLKKQPKSARHEGSNEECTARLGVNLRNFAFPYYDLMQGRLSAYSIYQFNDFVDDYFKSELYWWVREHRKRGSTIKDAIYSFMVFYSVTEEDIAFETLRKAVQRNAELQPRKKSSPKSKNFSVNPSQKIDATSRKSGRLSQKNGVLSHKAMFATVRQELMKLPLPIFETHFFYAGH
jgi:hypothetical protein